LKGAACIFLRDKEDFYKGLFIFLWSVAIKLRASRVLRPLLELALTSSLKQVLKGKREIQTIAEVKGLLGQRKK
jgi:hypothetical protein